MTAQLDVEALVGRGTRWADLMRSVVPDDEDCDDIADLLSLLLAHIAGEDARVAAAVAGERERVLKTRGA